MEGLLPGPEGRDTGSRHGQTIEPPRYRGRDRRRPAEVPVAHPELAGIATGLSFCALLLALSWIVADGDLRAPSGSTTAALALGVVLALAARMYWRTTGEAIACTVSTGAWLLVGSQALPQLLTTAPSSPGIALQRALVVLAPLWFIRALIGPQVDTGLRPWRQITTAFITALLLAAPIWAAMVTASTWVVDLLPQLVAAGLWLLVGFAGLLRRRYLGSHLVVWTVLMATAFSGAHLLAGTTARWIQPATDLLVAGTLLAAGGTVYALYRRAQSGREQVHHIAMRAEERSLDHRRLEQERRHEIRNVLMAVEGASLTLQRNRDRLAPYQQQRLEASIRSELAHLRDLVMPIGDEEEPLPLREILDHHAQNVRTSGQHVEVAGDPDVVALGERAPLIRSIDEVLAYVDHHLDPDEPTPIEVTVTGDQGAAYLWVEGEGPHIPRADRAWLFERGRRGRVEASGSPAGLYLARERLRDLGGDLRLGPPTNGGVVLVLSLPRHLPAGIKATEDDGSHHGMVPAEGGIVLKSGAPRLRSQRAFRLAGVTRAQRLARVRHAEGHPQSDDRAHPQHRHDASGHP